MSFNRRLSGWWTAPVPISLMYSPLVQVARKWGFMLFAKEGLAEYMEDYVYADAYPSFDDCNFRLSRRTGTS